MAELLELIYAISRAKVNFFGRKTVHEHLNKEPQWIQAHSFKNFSLILYCSAFTVVAVACMFIWTWLVDKTIVYDTCAAVNRTSTSKTMYLETIASSSNAQRKPWHSSQN